MRTRKEIQNVRDMLNRVKYLQESTVTNFGRYVIREYDPINNSDDRQYLTEHSKEIWDFMNDGYMAAINDKFVGCANFKSVKRNANFYKIAFSEKGEYIAISLYTGYRFGKKCAGITATTNEQLRDLGKEAVKEIIKEDATHPLDFFWCECSGVVEYLFEKYGGIKIHNEFVQNYLGEHFFIKELSNDGYHYVRTLTNGKDVTKVIVGFNTQETFDIVYRHYKDEIDQRIESIKQDMEDDQKRLNESQKQIYDYDYEFAEYVVGDFMFLIDEGGIREFPEYFLNMVKQSITTIKMCILKGYEDSGAGIERVVEALQYITPLECYHYVGTQAIDLGNTQKLVAESKN